MPTWSTTLISIDVWRALDRAFLTNYNGSGANSSAHQPEIWKRGKLRTLHLGYYTLDSDMDAFPTSQHAQILLVTSHLSIRPRDRGAGNECREPCGGSETRIVAVDEIEEAEAFEGWEDSEKNGEV
ncbi:hypothetical protein BGZ97_007670 [Linnemannia gamsii]|uniref:Uncharacterized protein n=1 Tax=Linnemannia gamsii TaxID=64522 RepID=A0A9P6RAI4_9FUNG|nr:hypothetical protein BGZ97_007670 [Linnemannia gamsii]